TVTFSADNVEGRNGRFIGVPALLEFLAAHAKPPMPIGKPVAVGHLAYGVDCATCRCRPLLPLARLDDEFQSLIELPSLWFRDRQRCRHRLNWIVWKELRILATSWFPNQANEGQHQKSLPNLSHTCVPSRLKPISSRAT